MRVRICFSCICMLLSITLLLTACASPAYTAVPTAQPQGAMQPEETMPQLAAEAPAHDPDANKVWPDPGIEGNLPENPSPGQDFSAYANYDWYTQNSIPQGYSRWTSFNELAKIVENQMIETLKAPSQSADQQKAAALFASAMDTATRDAAGNGALMESFHAVEQVKSIDALSGLLAEDGALYFFTPLVKTYVEADMKNSRINVARIDAPSLSLEDAAEYATRTAQGDRFKAANDTYYKALLTHNGVMEEEADTMIADAFAFEEKLSVSIYPLSTSYREDYYTLIYNAYTKADLAALSPNFPLMDVLDNAGLKNASRFIVSEPEAIKTLNALYTEENLPGIKAYLMIALLSKLGCYGDTFSEKAYITWTNEKHGASGVMPAEQRAYEACNIMIDELMGKVYAAKYFDEASKNDITEMVHDITDVFKTRIQKADWLTEATRQTAMEKLDALTLRIGYPTSFKYDWDTIEISAEKPLIENVMNLTAFISTKMNEKADQPVDMDVWELSANTVNAYYNPSDNSINFPAAILQPPFYDPSASRSANLGGIGSVIAHEITHAFDTKGSQFDKDGNMNNWWTKEDRSAFQARTDAVLKRYAAIEVLDGEHVRGDLTIGETVADLGAMACTLTIMREMDDANYDAYFRVFARTWAEHCTPERRLYQLKNDPHAPCYLRANVTVQQYQEFYDTYDVTENDFMYTAPADRLRVW